MVSYLQVIQGKDQKSTLLQLVDKMKVKQKEIGMDLKREHMEQLVIQLIIERVLKEEFQHTAYATNAYVSLGPLAKQVLQGKKTVKLQICCEQEKKAGGIKASKRKSASSNLEFRLDDLRKELASLHGGIFPHSILSTQQISMLAAEKPDSMEQLEKIIGKVKSEKYGTKILEEIVRCSEHEKHGSEVTNEQETGTATKKAKTQRSLESEKHDPEVTDEQETGRGTKKAKTQRSLESKKHDPKITNEQETGRATKKAKTQRSLVLIESSDDEN